MVEFVKTPVSSLNAEHACRTAARASRLADTGHGALIERRACYAMILAK